MRTELLLLLKCAQHFIYQNALDEINTLIAQNEIDWQSLLEHVTTHSIRLPLLHVLIFNKIKNIPAEFLQKIQKIHRFFINRNRFMAQEMLRVDAALKANNLLGIPYKGLPFASQFYGNTIQRVSVDIDFAMDISRFREVKVVMEELGYDEFKGSLHEDTIEKSRAFYLDYPFVLKKGEQIIFNVEFHWTPSHHILNIPIKFEEFMDKTEEIKIGKFKSTSFNKVYQALFAVIHHGNVDCWGKLKHLVDLGLMLKVLTPMEQEELEQLCKKYKIYQSLQIGKALLGILFDDPRYQNMKVSKKWTKDIVEGQLRGKWSDNKMKFYYFISSRDSFLEKIKSTYSIVNYQLFIKPKLEDA